MTRDELLATLQITEHDNYTFDERSYFDWSTRDGQVVNFEVGDEDGNVAQLQMTDELIAELHHRLTLWLLNR